MCEHNIISNTQQIKQFLFANDNHLTLIEVNL